MKKAISLMLALAMCVCLLAACGKDEQTETEPQVQKIFELGDEKITAENVSPYEGAYLENGDEEQVSGLYAMKFTNIGNKTIQSAQIIFGDGTQELVFQFEMLPVGQTITVVEWNKLSVAAEELKYIDSNISYLEDGLENAGSIEVIGGEDGVIQVKNITDEALPLVRIFYRNTDSNGSMIGGPCHSALLDGIAPGETIQVEADYWDDSCVVVTVLVVNQ